MKLFVGVPAGDRRITCETARALLNEQSAAALLGIELQISFAPDSSLVTTARDQLANDFLASEADRLVFVDNDVSWPVGTLIKLAAHKVDLVGGAYRKKCDEINWPVGWLDRPELWADPQTGLIEVASLPGGFLSVSRSVFQMMREAHPERRYSHDGHAFHAFFCCPYGGGEDGEFCSDWRRLGGQVWLDPDLTLTHHDGGRQYPGCIGGWLKARA